AAFSVCAVGVVGGGAAVARELHVGERYSLARVVPIDVDAAAVADKGRARRVVRERRLARAEKRRVALVAVYCAAVGLAVGRAIRRQPAFGLVRREGVVRPSCVVVGVDRAAA